MRSSRGFLQNLSILTLGQVASQLLNVWALVFLADRLGAHWFGVVQVGVAFMGYALVVAEGGFFNLGIREVSRLDRPGDVIRYASRHTGLLTLQAAAVLAGGLLLMPILPFHAADPWILTIYLATVLPQVGQLEWLATGLERMPWVSLARTVRSLTYALLVLVALGPLTGVAGIPAPRWVPLLFVAAMFAGNGVVTLAARRWFGRWVLPSLPPWPEIRRRWLEAAPIGAGNIVLRVLLNVDLIVLGLVATPEAAGHYAAASRVIFLLVVAVEVLWSALLPRQSRLAARDAGAFRRAFNFYLGGVLAVLLPVAVGGRLLGAEIIALLYRGQYTASVPVFANLALSYSLLAVAMYLGNSLVADNRQGAYVRPLALGAVVAAGVATVFGRTQGAVGASWGMLAGHTVLAVTLVWVTRRYFQRELAFLVVRLIPALLLLALVVDRTGSWPTLVRIPAAGAVFLVAAVLPWRAFQRWYRRSSSLAEGSCQP